MADTLLIAEEAPAAYPATPGGLSDGAAMLDPTFIWQRIEAYTAHRWSPRVVTWLVEGAGDWRPTLAPAQITEIQRWSSNGPETITLQHGPFGIYPLPSDARYSITGTVGGDLPAAGAEAFRRLAEYLAEDQERSGASSYSFTVGDVTESFQRNPAWLGRAMQNSGAADLLRPYRRA